MLRSRHVFAKNLQNGKIFAIMWAKLPYRTERDSFAVGIERFANEPQPPFDAIIAETQGRIVQTNMGKLIFEAARVRDLLSAREGRPAASNYTSFKSGASMAIHLFTLGSNEIEQGLVMNHEDLSLKYIVPRAPSASEPFDYVMSRAVRDESTRLLSNTPAYHAIFLLRHGQEVSPDNVGELHIGYGFAVGAIHYAMGRSFRQFEWQKLPGDVKSMDNDAFTKAVYEELLLD